MPSCPSDRPSGRPAVRLSVRPASGVLRPLLYLMNRLREHLEILYVSSYDGDNGTC